MNKVFLVRHCEPCNRDYGNNLRNLSNKGYEDAKNLVEFFKNEKIDAIFSSPYTRAIETIEPTANEFGIEIIKVQDFRERRIKNGVIDDFDSFAKKQWENFDYKLDGGESLREVQDRTVDALMAIMKENKDKNIIISGHGTSISTVINFLNEDFNYENFREFQDVMPFIVEITFENNEPRELKIFSAN